MKPTDAYNVEDDDMREDHDEDEPYHVTFLNDILMNAQGSPSWVMRGVEGFEVELDE